MATLLKVLNKETHTRHDFKVIRETKTKWVCINNNLEYQFSKKTLHHVGYPKDSFVVDGVIMTRGEKRK